MNNVNSHCVIISIKPNMRIIVYNIVITNILFSENHNNVRICDIYFFQNGNLNRKKENYI